jgi:hypothetical protein
VIDYVLGRSATGPLSLEILDASGALVRRYRSDDPPEPTPAELKRQLIPPYWVRPSRNPGTSAGMHRFVWDLHYAAPFSTTHSYPISAVPHDTPRGPFGVRALPGRYQVRLSVDGAVLTAPLTVKPDPRVETPPAALQQQFELATTLSSMVNDGSHAAVQARSVKEQLRELSGRAKGSVTPAISALEAKVSALLGGDSPAGEASSISTLHPLVRTVLSLYRSVEQADAAPTAAQVRTASTLQERLEGLRRQWQTLLAQDVPALNRELQGAGLPVLRPHAPVSEPDPGVDRDEG